MEAGKVKKKKERRLRKTCIKRQKSETNNKKIKELTGNHRENGLCAQRAKGKY